MGPDLYRSKETSIDAKDQFQVHTIQLVPSVGALYWYHLLRCEYTGLEQNRSRKADYLILASETSVDRYFIMASHSFQNSFDMINKKVINIINFIY